VNQYPPGPGHPGAARGHRRPPARFYGLDLDPDTEVLVTAGATEALAGALLGMLDAGDEVVVFEPMYDSYQACIALAGAVAVPVLLRPGGRRPTTGSTRRAAAAVTRARS
jgi:N-succinyldiaminopimelate aminotransferase